MSAEATENEPSVADHQAELDAIATFFTSVVRVEQRSPLLRRITFGGGDLHALRWLSPDQFFYFLLPPEGHSVMSIDHTFTWETVRELPDVLQPRGAYYTLRHHRPDAAEVDFDVVLHQPGPAAAWAAGAAVGDVAALWGPRTAWHPPSDTQWYVLVADETGLPGVGAILEHLPADATVHVVVEVADELERQPLHIGPNVRITWLHRGGAPAGTTGGLASAVQQLTASPDWPTGPGYAWGGGESREMTAVRRLLRHDAGMARRQVSMVGYWRRTGEVGDDQDDRDDQDDDYDDD
jgi:NADPH-dependent ferric siderophore reductase